LCREQETALNRMKAKKTELDRLKKDNYVLIHDNSFLKQEVRELVDGAKAGEEKIANLEVLTQKTKLDLETAIRSIRAENSGLLSNLSAAAARERKLREDMENLEAQRQALENLLLKALSRVR